MVALPTIAVIGAGISGITAAQKLRQAGFRTSVFEKSRGAGGRLATRRTPSGASLDHGAQYFTVRSSEFQCVLQDAGPEAVSAWDPPMGGAPAPRGQWLVPAPAMNSLVKRAAAGLDVHYETQVTAIEPCGDRWRLHFGEAHAPEIFDRVIITAPASQAAALTPFSAALQASLSSIRMSACWALMLVMKTPSPIAHDVLLAPAPEIGWLARNSCKPGRDRSPETWVGHASPGWSEQFLELEKDAARARLTEAVLPLLNLEAPDIDFADAHRWRFAKVEQAAGKAFLQDETRTLSVCGDGCLGARVEAAFLSAHALAASITAEFLPTS